MCRQSREALGSLTYELAAAIYRRAFETAKVSTLIYRIRICWRVKVSLGYPTSIYHKPTSQIFRVSWLIAWKLVHATSRDAWRVQRITDNLFLCFQRIESIRGFRPVPSFLCWQFIEAKLLNFIFLHLGFATRKSKKEFSHIFLGYSVLEFFLNFLATSIYIIFSDLILPLLQTEEFLKRRESQYKCGIFSIFKHHPIEKKIIKTQTISYQWIQANICNLQPHQMFQQQVSQRWFKNPRETAAAFGRKARNKDHSRSNWNPEQPEVA